MSTHATRDHPNMIERVEYLCGKHLPDSMHDWVVRDTIGPGHNRRYFQRGVLLFVPFVIVVLVVPAAWWVKVALIAIMLLPAIYFLAGMRTAYLQELKLRNDIDPALEGEREHSQHLRRAEAYDVRYRSRSDR